MASGHRRSSTYWYTLLVTPPKREMVDEGTFLFTRRDRTFRECIPYLDLTSLAYLGAPLRALGVATPRSTWKRLAAVFIYIFFLTGHFAERCLRICPTTHSSESPVRRQHAPPVRCTQLALVQSPLAEFLISSCIRVEA